MASSALNVGKVHVYGVVTASINRAASSTSRIADGSLKVRPVDGAAARSASNDDVGV